MNSYLLECSDYTIISHYINELIEKNNFQQATISSYNLSETPLERALEDLDTYGFLASKKVVIINEFDKLKYEEQSSDLEHLLKYLKKPSEDNLLFITAAKLDDRKKIVKDLRKNITVIKTTMDTATYIKNSLNGYKLENNVTNLISELCLNDITKIKNECEKLKIYKNKEKTITVKDVEELVIKKVGDANNIIFSFTRALAEKDKSQSLKLYNELLEYQFEPLSILALLESQFRIMYQVKILEKNIKSNEEIAKTLNEKSSYRISKTKELTRYYSSNEILDILIKLSEIDFKIKTTSANSNLLIQLLVLNI